MKEEEGNYDYAMKIGRITMNLMGMWPLNNTIYDTLKLVLTFSSAQLMFVTSFAYLRNAETQPEIIDCLINSLVILVTIVKLVIVMSKPKTLRSLIIAMENDWMNYKGLTSSNRRLLDLYAKRGRLGSFICIFFMEFSTIVYMGSKLVLTLVQPEETRVWKLPYAASYPFGLENPLIFVATYLWQLYSAFNIGAISIAVDCLVIITACHATGQLAALCENIKLFNEKINHADKTECLCIKCIVDRHVGLARYCQLIEDSYNLILLAEFIGTTLQFCFQIYIIVMHSTHKNLISIFAFAVFIVVLNFRMFLYCNYFDSMVEMGENIKFSVYGTNWYDFHPNSMRLLMFCIVRANKPFDVTAGKFFRLNYVSYKNVIMTACSYASVLLSLK